MQTDPTADGFRITSVRLDGEARIVFAGEIDLAARAAVEDAVDAAVDHGRVVVDLTDVTFLDSTGLAAVARAIRKQASVSVVNPNPAVRQTLRTSGIDQYIQIVGGE